MAPTFFALIVGVAGLFVSRTGALYWQVLLCLFGATAAITLPALGGAVITPSVMFLPFLLARAFAEQHAGRLDFQISRAGFWLALAVLCGLVGAVFLPRMFAGAVNIISVDRTSSAGVTLYPLRPGSGNITQSGYAVGALFTFLAFRSMLQRPRRLAHFMNAVLLLASLDCAAAAINLAEFYLGLPSVLEHVRNAYALFDAYESAGLMRIHGTFSETSAFCGFSLPLFAFTFSLWLHKVRPLWTGTLAGLLLVFLLISTSATAYGGLSLYGTFLLFVITRRGYVRGAVPRIGVLVAGALLVCVLVGSNFMFETAIARHVESYLQTILFDKLESASGIERSLWNRQAWANFVETYGLGVGLGSARASSFFLVLLSNFGLVGTLCYLAFVRQVISTDGSPREAPVPEAARQAMLAALAGAMVSSAVFDLGIAFYAYAAAGSVAQVKQVARQHGYGYARRLAGVVNPGSPR